MASRVKTVLRPAVMALLLSIGACSTPAPLPQSHLPVPAALAPTPKPVPVMGEEAKFRLFLRDFRETALAAGIRPEIYDSAMSGLRLKPRIADLNQNQPEFIRQVWTYLDSAVSAQRIKDGTQALAANAAILAPIERKYGVPSAILVSIWGNETDFGHAHESFNLFEALANLAYDGPRADYARPELIAALKMMQREHYTPSQMTSSWAGAFGQTQFTPTTFLAHAVDGDGDGTIDLWHSSADALASAAEMLSDAGWRRGEDWGYEVTLPTNFPYEQADVDTVKSMADWRALGVRRVSGRTLKGEEGAIYLPAGARGPAFMILANFKIVLKYNNAASYALAVCTLADRISGYGPIQAAWPRDERTLGRSERIAFQTDLQKLGYDVGEIDGVLGRKSRAALRAFQAKQGLPADGFATDAMLRQLERATKR